MEKIEKLKNGLKFMENVRDLQIAEAAIMEARVEILKESAPNQFYKPDMSEMESSQEYLSTIKDIAIINAKKAFYQSEAEVELTLESIDKAKVEITMEEANPKK